MGKAVAGEMRIDVVSGLPVRPPCMAYSMAYGRGVCQGGERVGIRDEGLGEAAEQRNRETAEQQRSVVSDGATHRGGDQRSGETGEGAQMRRAEESGKGRCLDMR